jgi:hypothetical protein
VGQRSGLYDLVRPRVVVLGGKARKKNSSNSLPLIIAAFRCSDGSQCCRLWPRMSDA